MKAYFFKQRFIYNLRNFSKLSFGVSHFSFPLEGGGLGRGCSMEIVSNTLPLIPSPQGRGLRGETSEFAARQFIQKVGF
jgi:hypothetical protein